MLGLNELKHGIYISKDKVGCPVKECNVLVNRQTKSFKRHQEYKCAVHNIYISPTTFEYDHAEDNILWKEKDDLELLTEISKVKRESRMARDNSEDAVTWNVFRFLENNGLLSRFLQEFFKIDGEEPEIIYWSYSKSQKGLWDTLKDARDEFEQVPSKGSEPDIIILGKASLVFIEAKVTASNKTKPSNKEVEEKYTSGGENWWDRVVNSDFSTVAMKKEKYELARFWLLGTWMAERLNCHFILANLVLDGKEGDIESVFLPHIRQGIDRTFKRMTWEDIYQRVVLPSDSSTDKTIMESYFLNKTIGYRKGELRKAFTV